MTSLAQGLDQDTFLHSDSVLSHSCPFLVVLPQSPSSLKKQELLVWDLSAPRWLFPSVLHVMSSDPHPKLFDGKTWNTREGAGASLGGLLLVLFR